jgi:hypothetical protein
MRLTAAPILLAIMLLCACTPKTPPPPPAELSDDECPTLYVYAPGNFIIDIASGSEVVLDPMVREFPLFCSAETAALDLSRQLSSEALPGGDWRIYIVDGDASEIAQRNEDGRILLKSMAAIVDWVDISDN